MKAPIGPPAGASPRKSRRWPWLVAAIVVALSITLVGSYYLLFTAPGSGPGPACHRLNLTVVGNNASEWVIEATFEGGTCAPLPTAKTSYFLENATKVERVGLVSNLTGANGIAFKDMTLSRNTIDTGDLFVISRSVARPGYGLRLDPQGYGLLDPAVGIVLPP